MPSKTRMPKRPATIAEVSEILHCDHKTVRRMVSRGTLTAFRIGDTKLLRIDLDELEHVVTVVPTVAGGRRAAS